ncbi:hypothetical protein COD18_15500 [Bacillus cereus]|nr:hypothetical protein COD18_15500 [Bacillus cereus]
MTLSLDTYKQIEDELKDISKKANIAFKNKDVTTGQKVLTEYKTCALKLKKLLLDDDLENTGLFDEFINVQVADILEDIGPIARPNNIKKLHEQVKEDISYLSRNIGYVEECISIKLPITKNLRFEKKLSEVDYEKIIRDIYKYGIFMSETRASYKHLGEEDIRNLILNNMNSIYPNLIGTAETFNKNGHTDILLKNKEKFNVFIAECKLWKGPQKSIKEALDQLLTRYITEHDTKTALLIFNQKVTVETAKKGIKKHVLPHLKANNYNPKNITTKFINEDYVYYYLIKHPLDPDKTVELTVILININ